MGIRAAGGVSQPISGAVPSTVTGASSVRTIITRDITFAAGAVASLTGLAATTAVAGLLTTDQVLVQCTGSMPAGCSIANARCSVNGTLEITFTTAVVAGVTLGSLTYRVTIFR